MRILAAVLGSPIAHSKSPLLHRAALAALGLTTSEYSRFELGADELADFLDAHPSHTGFSLTMPLKDRLVELAGQRGWILDDTAELTGAGNTVVRTGETTHVANTDVRGIVRALAPHLRAQSRGAGRSGPGVGRATILGAGATAASALVACRDLGIGAVEFLVRDVRRAGRVLELAERLGITARTAGLERIRASEVIISTLPVDAAPDPDWDAGFATGDIASPVALDVAYAQESAFLAAAAVHDITGVKGTVMLVEQAVAQFEMFHAAAFGQAPADLRSRVSAAMYAALARAEAAADEAAADEAAADETAD